MVAAALQDAGRVKVVGEHTEGLADVRVVHSLRQGDGISLVVAHLLRRRGEKISGSGVIPDVSLGAPQPEPAVTLPDVPCPELKSVTRVGDDPAVALATKLLSSP